MHHTMRLLTLEPNDRFYQHYYTPVSREVLELSIVRGNADRHLHEGIECYLNEDYQCAIEKFLNSEQHTFYLGLAYLGIDEPLTAKGYLSIYQSSHPEFPDASWYLSLSLIRLNDLEEASVFLAKLSESENRYGKDAKKILKKINTTKAADRK